MLICFLTTKKQKRNLYKDTILF